MLSNEWPLEKRAERSLTNWLVSSLSRLSPLSVSHDRQDPNRPTWEQYKKDNEDKLDMGGQELRRMSDYRAELDRERDQLLAARRDKKRKLYSDSEDSSASDTSSLSEGQRKKKSKKDKKKKDKKKKAKVTVPSLPPSLCLSH
jgi:hypothetical protein